PAWNGTQSGGSATSYAQTTLGSDATATLATLQSTHLTDWHDFWNSAALMKTASDDGTGQYMQVLRTLDLYVANSSSSSSYPGSQAGVADLFSSAGDFRNWDPSAFWHWNLRMQTAANQSSGESQLNNPFFNLYLSNLKNMQTWTTVNMHIPGLLIGDGSDDCLDVTNGTHNTGNPVEIWGCSRGAANQTWAWNSTTKQYTVYQGQSYVMCLDTSGSSVVINPCSTATTQQWTPQANGQITNAAGKCLDTGGATTEGSAVSVQSCSNTADSGQIWRNPDICVPETMRFNGAGYENETWSSVADDCVNTDKSGAFYNARTLTTGAEVGLEVWNQYLDTGDTTFLSTYYPLMKYAAEFLLDYASTGADGKLHTYPSNAHETQWDVHDPTTDIAAMKALFPAVKSAAQKLNVDTGLRTELTNAIGKLRDFPLTYPSELVGARSGKCLDVTNGTHNTGNPVEIWGCSRGAANQTWAWNSTTKQYTVYQGQSYVMCLDTSGSSVVINPCSTATTQQWTPQTNGQITNAAGMCLDVTGGFMTDGTAVGVYACASPVSDNQIWSNVIAMSADVSAGTDNFQNVGLEPVWPYGLIGDDTSLTALGKTTFLSRPFSVGGGGGYDWNVDAIQAARLGLSDQFASTLKQAVVNNQVYANGFGYFGATASAPAAPDEFYGEQQGVVTTALNEALAQDYDGELRIAPSVPATWDADGTVAVQGGTRVSVQIHHGSIGPVGITAGPGVNPGTDGTYTITVRNPWPGSAVQVVDGSNTTNVVVASTTSSQINITATSGHTYVVEQVSAPIGGMTYQQVTATPASQPITLTGNIGTTGVTRTIGF
ncbi:ricin-type beta-trefoil lectin domain protein, partial [Streptomyces sp. NPDC020801]